jgi:hypothetical protein
LCHISPALVHTLGWINWIHKRRTYLRDVRLFPDLTSCLFSEILRNTSKALLLLTMRATCPYHGTVFDLTTFNHSFLSLAGPNIPLSSVFQSNFNRCFPSEWDSNNSYIYLMDPNQIVFSLLHLQYTPEYCTITMCSIKWSSTRWNAPFSLKICYRTKTLSF